MRYFRELSIGSVGAWLVLFALIPIVLMLCVSFLQHDASHLIIWHFTTANYQQLFSSVFVQILWRSLIFSCVATAVCLLLAYPAAYCIALAKPQFKALLLMLMIVPFWTSSLIRTYAIMAIIKARGILNSVLLHLHVIHQPLQILYSTTAVYIGIVYTLLPFMILPLYSNFEKLDFRIVDAARDLGASRLRIMMHIIVPLTMPGIMVGVLFVFLPAMTLFYVPDLLGGARSLLMGNLVENQFLLMNDWPGGAATSMLLTLILLLMLLVVRKSAKAQQLEALL